MKTGSHGFDIPSFDESKRKTFGTVDHGVEKYECYISVMGGFANLYGKYETYYRYASDLKILLWYWRECHDNLEFVYL